MPLKSPTQLSTVAEYKKLIQTDARALTATGLKFHYFGKYTFPDKSTSPVILFGAIDNTLLATIGKNGAGPASGQATINETDEIVLEIANGTVAYGGLSKALKGWGVIRQLHIPEGAEESETSSGAGGGPAMPAPVAGKAPVVPPRPQRPGASPVGASSPSGQAGMAPSAATGASPKPAAPEERKPGVAPVVPPRPPRAGAMPAAAVGSPQTNPTAAKASPPLAGAPPVPPRAKPAAATGNPPASPSAPSPQKAATPNPGATAPVRGTMPPQQAPPATPPSGPKKVFEDRFKELNPRYQATVTGPIPGAFKPLFDGMIIKAKSGDFPGALLAANKLDVALSKAEFSGNKLEKQKNRAAKLSATFGAVKKSYFTPGGSDVLAREKLNAGKHFKAFLAAQKAFEIARDEKTLDALETEAQAYLEHYRQDLGPNDKQKPESLRKLEICQTAAKAARHYRLALEQDKIGAPPWDEEKEIRASELYSKLLFEQEDGKLAKANESAGVSGSWWVEKTVFADEPANPNKQQKTFIFKPTDVEGDIPGFPKGGSAAREVLGKAIGDQLQAVTGLNFGVPETALISVDGSKLADPSGKPGKAEPRVGSVQHFSKSLGQFSDLKHAEPNFAASLPEEEVHKMAVFDLIQLNLDRHPKNFMVAEENGKRRLVPIDHGLVVPSRNGLRARRLRNGAPASALGALPIADKKLAPELLEKIKQIDPDEVVASMKKAYDAMAKLHPEAAKAAEITEENFKLTKRSIQFLKKAGGELTLAEIQDAYVAGLEKVFETPDDQIEAGFDEAIRMAKARTPARKEVLALLENPKKFRDELIALGWAIDFAGDSMNGWVILNAEKVMKALKSKTENPVARKELNELLVQLKDEDPSKLQSQLTLGQRIVGLRTMVRTRRNRRAEQVYGVTFNDENGQMMEAYESLGGEDQLKKLQPDVSKLSLKERFEALALGEINRLGGDAELTKIAKQYPNTQLDSTTAKLGALRAAHEYQQLGGDKESSNLGVSSEDLTINGRLAQLKDMMPILAVT